MVQQWKPTVKLIEYLYGTYTICRRRRRAQCRLQRQCTGTIKKNCYQIKHKKNFSLNDSSLLTLIKHYRRN